MLDSHAVQVFGKALVRLEPLDGEQANIVGKVAAGVVRRGFQDGFCKVTQ